MHCEHHTFNMHWLHFLIWLFISVLWNSFFVSGLDDQSVILRPNIGIILERVGSQDFMPSYWHHTIAIPIVAPTDLLKPLFTLCKPIQSQAILKKDPCGPFPTQWQTLIKESQRLANHLISDIEENEQTIKDVIALEINHKKRGWFNFLGTIAKKVMGVATEDDVKTLAKHVQQLGVMVQSRDHERKTILENMHSYEIATNRRLDIMHKQVRNLETLTTGLAEVSDKILSYFSGNNSLPIQIRQLREHVTANEQLTRIIHTFNLHFETLQAIKSSTSTLISDLNLLVKGKLSPSLVNPALLRSILNSIKQNINKISPQFSITSSVQSYYSENNWITTTFEKSHLFIKLKIRVTTNENNFNIFKVSSYPIPLGSSASKVHTRLSGFSKYFGISGDNRRYLEMNNFNPDKDLTVVPKEITNTVCSYNIFKGKDKEILAHCTKIIERSNNTKFEVIHKIAHNNYVILSTDSWKIVCNDSVLWKSIEHRSMFSVKLKCDCQLTNGKVTLFPDISACVPSNNSVAYSSNAFAYFGLYQRLVDINLTVSNFHDEPFQFEVPEFRKIIRNLTRLDTLDESEAYEVHDLEMVLNNSLHHQDEFDDSMFFDWWIDYSLVITPSAISISFVFDICEFVLIGFVFYKLKTLEHRVALGFSLLPLTEAINFTLPVSTTASPVQDIGEASDLWKSVLLIMSLVLASYSIIQQWVDRCSNAQSCCLNPVVLEKLQCDIYVCLYGNNEFAHIKVETIPCRLDDLVIYKADGLDKIKLKCNFCGPSILIDWSLIKLGILNSGRIQLPTHTRLSIVSCGKVRRLVRNYHTASVVGVSGEDHRIICTTEVSPTRPFWRYPVPTTRISNRSISNNDNGTNVQLVVTGSTKPREISGDCQDDDSESDVV